MAKTISVQNVEAGSAEISGRSNGGINLTIDELDPDVFIDECSDEEKKLLLDAIGSDFAVEHFELELAEND